MDGIRMLMGELDTLLNWLWTQVDEFNDQLPSDTESDEGDGGSNLIELSTKDVVLFSTATPEQADLYWSYSGLWSSELSSYRWWMCVQRQFMEIVKSLPNIKEEFWLRHRDDPIIIYTGAIARQRPALVSTTKGAKVVKGMVISQLSTHAEYRRRGSATQFLRLLAEEMDRREGKDRIAFSVMYSGPNTDFFKKRG